MTTEAAAILRAAADLITPVGAWVQGAYATDAEGEVASSSGMRATCWCMDGAVRRVGLGKRAHGAAITYLIQACTPITGYAGRDVIHEWNDALGRTQAECVAKLQEAAALAEAGR